MNNREFVDRLIDTSDRRHVMNRIRERREAVGLSQAELARASGIAQESISRLEGGQDYARGTSLGRPRIATLQRLATAMSCRWWELMSEEDLEGLRATLMEELDRASAKVASAGVPLSEARTSLASAYARSR